MGVEITVAWPTVLDLWNPGAPKDLPLPQSDCVYTVGKREGGREVERESVLLIFVCTRVHVCMRAYARAPTFDMCAARRRGTARRRRA